MVRLRFVQDDSCHWYAIPAEKREAFDRWVESFSDERYDAVYDGEDFDEYRLGMHPSFYTFADLKEDA